MKTKDFLREYYWLDKNIRTDRERLEHYRSIAEGVGGNKLSKMPGAASQGDKMSHFACKAADLENIIKKRIVKLIEKEKEIAAAINSVESELYKRILTLRYISLLKWHDIADDLGYSMQRTFELHGEALKAVKRSE